ncbi:MAG: alpha/beta hydrolase [Coleofasciculus sp. B1-GNL1-01]|uniref:alpha/beta fold hydrolase n=1 Tax=Coleofasciculus sp. B1-GNL1-01 TaxID=3068484 RepID=UPI0032F4F43B
MNLTLRNSRIKLPLGQVFWREVGTGPTLIFLHGSWSDSSQWLPLIEYLHQEYHCFALDLLGFGDSETPKLHYSIQVEVECLFNFIEALHLPQVYLVGHSLGAWIAASYALRHPEQVQGLVLLAPEGIRGDGNWKNWQWLRWLVGRPPLAYTILRSLLPLARMFGRHKEIERALKQRQQLLQSPTACQLLFRRRRLEIQAELLHEHLPDLDIPTLILQGRQDSLEVINHAQTYANHSPNTKLQMIDQAGNDLAETVPGIVAQHIDYFVKYQ